MAKITPEELQQVKDLQSKYNQTIFEIGVAEAQKLAIEDQLEKILANKKGLVSDLATIEKKEADLIAALQTKYGEGSIDAQTGEITPAQ